MPAAYLSLGANIGDPRAQIETAIDQIAALPETALAARSAIVTTAPWGKTDQPDFKNAAIAIDTQLSPVDLLDALQDIERTMGRERREKWGPRLIDIDIVAYEQFEVDVPGLTLPHPRAHERAFVLDPLREIAPAVADWLVTRKT